MLPMGKRIVRPAHCTLGGNPATELVRLTRPVRSLSQRGSSRNESRLLPETRMERRHESSRPPPPGKPRCCPRDAGTRGPARACAGPPPAAGTIRRSRAQRRSEGAERWPAILQETASPIVTPASIRSDIRRCPCAIRTAASSAAAEKVVRRVSTVQKWESWMPRGANARNPAPTSAVRLPENRRTMRYTSHTVSRDPGSPKPRGRRGTCRRTHAGARETRA